MGAPNLEDLPHYTFDDYLQWEGRWELIDGIAYAMAPAPMKKHQALSGKMARLLDEALDACDTCYASLPVDWKIAEDTVVQPDNLIICESSEGFRITQAPPLVVEILSPSTRRTDEGRKYRLYESEGVTWYLIVDPEEKIVRIFENVNGGFTTRMETTDETFTFDRLPCEVTVDFSRLWRI